MLIFPAEAIGHAATGGLFAVYSATGHGF